MCWAWPRRRRGDVRACACAVVAPGRGRGRGHLSSEGLEDFGATERAIGLAPCRANQPPHHRISRHEHVLKPHTSKQHKQTNKGNTSSGRKAYRLQPRLPSATTRRKGSAMRTASHRNLSSVPGGVRGPAALPTGTHCGTNASYHAARSIAATAAAATLLSSEYCRAYGSDPTGPPYTAAASHCGGRPTEPNLDGHGYCVRRLEQLFVVRTRRARREDLQLCSPQH